MIYLDNCSTTKPRDEVVDVMMIALKEDFGNPSSLHRLGMKSEKKMEGARDVISKFLKVDSKEIYFTSGGTESNNLAIQSIIDKYRKRGNHIITTKIEHPSVMNIMKHYEKLGLEVTYLSTDEFGYINMDELGGAIREDTFLVSIIHVNNELGAIQDIETISNIIQTSISKPILHLDGVQSFGKIEFSLRNFKVDSYSFSGHKVYGPKGIGGLYINSKLNLEPIVYGGNQESGIRSGTENMPGIIGFGEAVRIMSNDYIEDATNIQAVKSYMAEKIIKEIDDIKLNTTLDKYSSPYILSISFKDIRGEVLLHYLEDKDIYVSTSSACSSHRTDKSYILKAIKCTDNEIEGTIRFCFSYETSKEDIDYVVENLKSSVEEIRSIIRR